MRTVRIFVGTVLMAGLLGGCASIEPKSFPETAMPSEELPRQQKEISRAEKNGVGGLSPKSFKAAKQSYDRALQREKAKKPPGEVLEELGRSVAWLERAENNAKQFEDRYADLISARSQALSAKAPNQARSQWKSAEYRFQGLVKDFESGDRGELSVSERNYMVQGFIDAHVAALRETYLNRTYENMLKAKEKDAETYIPNIYREALRRVREAEGIILANRADQERIKLASAEAERVSAKALDILNRARSVDGSSIEKVALELDRVESLNESLKTRLEASTEKLQTVDREFNERLGIANQAAAFQEKLREIEERFPEEKAQVLRKSDSLIIRLKGLDFAVGQTEIPSRDFELLTRVKDVLKEVPTAKLILEGHADSTGGVKINESISLHRAQAVRDFIVADGAFPADRIEVKALGEDQPIATNRTPEGRSENRRVDVLLYLEPEVNMAK